ncbi:unnamed protein product [Acanthoscelides obtectus]|nr:unnamed protein product [Acanthoscelides obtectus]CAK1640721.1 E3 ubiquitin-protein ligase IAP-3 [Acanthoscelides obtectus]
MSNICIHPLRSYLDQTDNGSKKDQHTPDSPDPHVLYSSLEDRLKTFDNWPNKQISSKSLAEAGFIYKGEDDIVVCPFCNIEGYHWLSDDNPMADHRVWSPNCTFLMSNIEHDHSESRTEDTCGLYGVEVLPNSVPEGNINLDLSKLGIQKSKGPQYNDKITYESRLATFDSWPKSIKQKPVDLAEAGFFYTGVGDQTLCFYCGGGLKDWEDNDDPWEQHALWFSKCVYLNLKKGKDYIEKIKKKEEAHQPATSSSQTKDEPTASVSAVKSDTSEKDEEASAAEKTLCKICFKNELGVVFLPCGHIIACVDCAAALKSCAVCRKPLEATVRAFLS